MAKNTVMVVLRITHARKERKLKRFAVHPNPGLMIPHPYVLQTHQKIVVS